MVKVKRKFLLYATGVISLGVLSGCGEWRTFPLSNPRTGEKVVCLGNRGALSSEDIERIHQCIDACRSKGFLPEDQATLPPRVKQVTPVKPPAIPLACQG
jgi:hypothetical protein